LRPQQLVSFFKFVGAAFKERNSFEQLDESDAYNPNRNFLCLSLSQIYAPIVENYLNLNITSEKEKSALVNEIFRLTLTLLSKFD
jgi:hypothetical protein